MIPKKYKKTPIIRSVLLTSLPAFLVAEFFFAFLYFLVMQGVQWIYLLLSYGSTASVEANMQIFSVVNIVIFVIALLIMSMIMVLEMATIIAITVYDWYKNDHIPLREIIVFAYQRMKQFFHLYSLPILWFVFLFPKEHIGPRWLLSLDIPAFITDEILKFPLYLVLIIAILILIAYIMYRSIFVLHYLLLERTTIKKAFINSFLLTKKIGFKKMFLIIVQNIFWIFLFTLPIIAIGLAFARWTGAIFRYLWEWAIVLSSSLNWLMEFLFVSLPWVLFLAGLTIAFIRYSGFHKNHFEKRFYFLSKNSHTPRWQNVRRAFSKKYPVVLMWILLALLPFFLAVIIKTSPQISPNIQLISHRGVSDGNFIENSFGGILEAKKQGANMVEIDIYEDADGTLILSHDSNLLRVTGVDKKISELTDRELENIHLKNNSTIPTFAEVVRLAKREWIFLIIEPKIHWNEKNFYENIIKILEENDMIWQVYIHSLHLDVLEKIKKMQPELKVWYIVFGGFGRFGALPVDFFSIQETALTRSMIENIHLHEKKVFVWTINEADAVEKFLRMWVDGIITDNIPLIQAKVSKILSEDATKPKTVFRIFRYEFSPNDFMLFWQKFFSKIF